MFLGAGICQNVGQLYRKQKSTQLVKIFRQAQPTLSPWVSGCRNHQQALGQGFELEQAIEPIGDGAQVGGVIT
jgi:hypothetical protein